MQYPEMANKFINVHIFDGRLKNKFTKTYSVEEKKEKFNQLIPKLKNNVAKIAVRAIISDLHNGQNKQIENNVDASDILMEIINLMDDHAGILGQLEEQLVDMKNLGFCPSGRVTRLFQIWNAYKN